MKSLTKSLILFLLFFFHVGTTVMPLLAQSVTTDQLLTSANECYVPQIINVPVVNFTDNSSTALLQFWNDTEMYISIKHVGTTEPLRQFFVEDGLAYIEGLEPNQRYQVYGKNSCQENVLLYSFDTNEGYLDEIILSQKMFDAIAAFQQQTDEPLTQFLSHLDNIPLIERASFLQQFNRFGQPIDKSEITNSLDGLGQLSLRLIECNCRALRLAAPFFNPGFSTPEQNIDGELLPNFQVKYPFGKRSSYWSQGGNKGPAKWHDFLSQGHKEKKNQLKQAGFSKGSLNPFFSGSQVARISLNLLCNDGQQLPAKCACDKPIYVKARYDSKIKTFAETLNGLGTGGGTKKSFASIQDIAFLTAHEDFSDFFKIIKGSTGAVSSECGLTVNPDFIKNWIDLAVAFVSAIPLGVENITIADKTISKDEIQAIADALKDVTNTPYYTPGSCTNSADETGFIAKDKLFLHVNTPMHFSLFTYDTLSVGGQRSWRSDGRILSDFYLDVVIPGGEFNPNYKKWCCTPIGASWVLGSWGGPVLNPKLRELVATDFFLWGVNVPLNIINGQAQVKSDYGTFAHLNAGDCEAIPIEEIPNKDRSSGRQKNIESPFVASIFSPSGRLVSVKDLNAASYDRASIVLSTKEEVKNHNNLSSGIYVVIIMSENKKIVDRFKLFVEKE